MQLRGDSFDESFFHWIIEIVLGKFQYFKNHPRANFLLLKSIWTVLIVYILAVFLFYIVYRVFEPSKGINAYINENFYHSIIASITGLLTAISVIYWQSAKIFYQKWHYCSNLYNKIISTDHKNHKEIYRTLSNALAIDLILLDLWAHRAFKEVFRDELKNAINNYDRLEIRNSIFNKVNNNQLSENEALHILQAYQYKILENESWDNKRFHTFNLCNECKFRIKKFINL